MWKMGPSLPHHFTGAIKKKNDPNTALLKEILQDYHTFASSLIPLKWVSLNDPCFRGWKSRIWSGHHPNPHHEGNGKHPFGQHLGGTACSNKSTPSGKLTPLESPFTSLGNMYIYTYIHILYIIYIYIHMISCCVSTATPPAMLWSPYVVLRITGCSSSTN